MKIFADFHIHSKYSRACSQDLVLSNLVMWAKKKGVGLLGTGDFTHPAWLRMLKDELLESSDGLFVLKETPETGVRFILTCEVALVYKQGSKIRRIHNLIFAPSLEAVDKLVLVLEKRGVNLKADGRPIFKMSCEELLKVCKEVDERMEVVPAHVWTPHFGVFGSMSGFDSLEEAFGSMAKYVFALETGLSSDPAMNCRLRSLENLSLISNSDAHSLRKLGREANVFELCEMEVNFDGVVDAIKDKTNKKFLYTIEFFPEEGKYYLNGHRDCGFSVEPKDMKRLGGLCSVCGKKILAGVLNRVEESSKSQVGIFKNPRKFIKTIPLEEILAESLSVGVGSKKVKLTYEQLVKDFNEFEILLDLSEKELLKIADPKTVEAISSVRSGKIKLIPGFDGQFGKIEIFSKKAQ